MTKMPDSIINNNNPEDIIEQVHNVLSDSSKKLEEIRKNYVVNYYINLYIQSIQKVIDTIVNFPFYNGKLMGPCVESWEKYYSNYVDWAKSIMNGFSISIINITKLYPPLEQMKEITSKPKKD
jgi:hypothetical protein